MRVPAAIVAIPLLIGCVIGIFIWDRVPASVPLCAAGATCLAVVAALGAFGCEQAEDCAIAVALGTLSAGLSLGVTEGARIYRPPLLTWFVERQANPANPEPRIPSPDPRASEPVRLEGILREDAAVNPLGVSLTVDVRRIGSGGAPSSGRSLGGVRLSIAGMQAAGRSVDWRAGRRIRLTATLRRPAMYLDPGVPDDRRALARRGVILVGTVKSAALVEHVQHGSFVEEQAAQLRAWVRARLSTSIGCWSARSAGIANAILIGDRTGLADEDARRLQQAGTYHVIAISGGNIAIVAALLLIAMRIMCLPSRSAAILAILCLLFYGRVTGSAASIDRAITAAAVYLAARVIDQRGSTLNVLAVAGIWAVAWAPIAALDPGFVLSFGATLGILVGASRLMPSAATHGQGRRTGRSRLRAVARVGVAVLAATAATEVALGPVSAALFSRVTFAGLALNFAAIPLMAAVQGGAMLTLASAAAPRMASLAGYGTHLAASALVGSARLVDLAPWLCRDVVPPAWSLVAVYYVAVVSALAFKRIKRVGQSVAITAALLIIAAPACVTRGASPPPADTLRIVFLDVGQGDSTLIILPDRRAVLVDAGGRPTATSPDPSEAGSPVFDVGERVVAPALRALGVRHLEALVATHGDPDHIGGARAVIRAFRPRAVWEGIPVPPHAGLRALISTAEASGATCRTVQAGDHERAAAVTFRVLHPSLPEWERQRVRNEDSVVLDVRFGDVSILLPGDIGDEGERAIRPLLNDDAVVVLKAPHHGSSSSSTPALLAALHPAIVVFSAGRANRFGHPHPAVVERYHALGAEMFSTADDGAIILDTDGRTVKMTGFTGRSVVIEARENRRSRGL